jgi:hypothetical protein
LFAMSEELEERSWKRGAGRMRLKSFQHNIEV